MRYGLAVLAALLAAAPAAAPAAGAGLQGRRVIAVAARRLSLDQIAKASRPSAPRRVIHARPR